MDEYLEILAELSVPEDYDPLDRYRDFRNVFLGSEQGRRVLKQILSWAHFTKPTVVKIPIDPYKVIHSEGERNLALRIFAIMLTEPKQKEKSTIATVEEDN